MEDNNLSIFITNESSNKILNKYEPSNKLVNELVDEPMDELEDELVDEPLNKLVDISTNELVDDESAEKVSTDFLADIDQIELDTFNPFADEYDIEIIKEKLLKVSLKLNLIDMQIEEYKKIPKSLTSRDYNNMHQLLDNIIYEINENMSYNKFECHLCLIACEDDTDLEEHLGIYHKKTINMVGESPETDVWQSSNILKLDPLDDSEEEDEPITEVLPDPYGQYICEICNNKFTTPNHLGEHFTLKHNNYDDQLILDERQVEDGFPGFKVLEYINMIQFETVDQNELCPICSEKYGLRLEGGTTFNRCIEFEDLDYVRGENVSIFKKALSCSNLGKIINKAESRIIRSDYVSVDFATVVDRRATRMLCCNLHICKLCIRKHIEHLNNIHCPFCKRDHNQSDDFIVYIEESDEADLSSWNKWWRRHIEIL